MRTTKIERVRGVNDILPDICTVEQQIAAQLSSCFQSFGYRPIDVPILEYTELYLRKSGEELISRMYDFTFYNRRLCLRPEFTASIVRAYI
ncbi:MAG: ATP phosphoribosyltransferase regulatory subunit, partial [Spirulinaceae cyanobacterium]